MTSSHRSLLPVVLAADSFPSSPYTHPYPSHHPVTGEIYTPFHLTFHDFQKRLSPIGMLRPQVIAEMQSDERESSLCPWQFHSTAREGKDEELELKVQCVFLADWVIEGGRETIGKVMQETVERWRDEGKFKGPLGGELYSTERSMRRC